MNEFDRIKKGLALIPAIRTAGVIVGPGDDAAVLNSDMTDVSISTDAMVEGIHFSTDWSSAEDIGSKLIHSSVSDLAAMGAKPWVQLLSVAFPKTTSSHWVEGFWKGVGEACRETSTSVIGGDTTVSPSQIFLSATVLGRHLEGKPLQRNTAKVGDVVYVTGWLGDSAAGLRCLQSGEEFEALLERHRRPKARIEWGERLGKASHVNACMDVSDGLIQDLGHMAIESQVGIQIFGAQVPLSEAFRSWSRGLRMDDAIVFACTGGEDYELVFTAPSISEGMLKELNGIPCTAIGRVVPTEERPSVTLFGTGETPLSVPAGGWDPFRGV